MAPLAVYDWLVRTVDGASTPIQAAYFNIDPDTKWVEFKDGDHKVVFAAPGVQIASIDRK